MYLRYPSSVKVNKEDRYVLFFISDETIWKLEAESFEHMQNGKYFISRHLFMQGGVSHLSVSPDGKFLAFTGSIENGFDVYVMPVEGGDPIRCTYLNSADLQVIRWDSDGVCFASSHESPAGIRIKHIYHTLFDTETGESKAYEYDLYTMGNARRSNLISCEWVSFQKDQHIVQINGYGYGNWKGYKGGTAAFVAKYDGREYKKITESLCNCVQPVMTKNMDIYYLTDDNGYGNLYVYKNDENKEITKQDKYCTLDLSYDNQDFLYYTRAGKIYVYDIKSEKEVELNITFKAHKPQIYPRFAHETDQYTGDDLTCLTSFALNKDGTKLGLTMRGQACVLDRYVTNAINIGDFGYTMLNFLGDKTDQKTPDDKDSSNAISKERSKERYLVVKAGLSEELLVLDSDSNIIQSLTVIGSVVSFKANSSNDKVAFVNSRTELYVWDLKENKTELIKPAQQFTSISYDWSSDGRYLAYACRRKNDSETVSYITILDTTDYSQHDLPRQMWDCECKFSADGKYLYFLSNRAMKMSYDDVSRRLNFSDTFKPYLVILEKDGENPFRPWMYEKNDKKNIQETSKDEEDSEESADNEENTEEDTKVASIEIDFTNIDKRIIPFPVSYDSYIELLPIQNGVMFLKSSNKVETMKKGVSAEKYKLEKFCFQTQQITVVLESLSNIALSDDKKVMAVISEEHIKILEAGSSSVKEAPWKQAGIVDWNRIGLEIKQDKEFELIFQQAFLLVKELFHHQEEKKIDWDNLYKKYYPLVKEISCRNELNQIIREMQGELGTSHSYIINPGDVRSIPKTMQGYLGGRLKYIKNESAENICDKDGYEIVEIYPSKTWSDKHLDTSPLYDLEVGDKIISIQGRKLDEKYTPHLALKNTANRFIQIEVKKKNSSDNALLKKYIRPLPTEKMLLYTKWIEFKKEIVSKATNNQIGYIHIPDMDVRGYEQFCREYYQQYHKKGLIIDVRSNGGGYVSPFILDILTRKRTGSVATKYEITNEPTETCSGNLVFLCDEYTGSDGDIFSYHVKRLGLGKLIGKRTWGGVVGISVRNYFIDGGLASQPEYAISFDGSHNIENHGVDPDLTVENKYRNIACVENEGLDYDIQLAKAIETILETGIISDG